MSENDSDNNIITGDEADDDNNNNNTNSGDEDGDNDVDDDDDNDAADTTNDEDDDESDDDSDSKEIVSSPATTEILYNLSICELAGLNLQSVCHTKELFSWCQNFGIPSARNMKDMKRSVCTSILDDNKSLLFKEFNRNK